MRARSLIASRGGVVQIPAGGARGHCALAAAQQPAPPTGPPADIPATQTPAETTADLAGIRPYLGLKVHRTLFPGLPESEQDDLRKVIPIKVGGVITREGIHDSMQAILGTGRFADVQLEATRTDDGSVDLAFVTAKSFFVGDIRVEGNAERPTANQIVNSSKLN